MKKISTKVSFTVLWRREMESLLIKQRISHGVIAVCTCVLLLTSCQIYKGTSTQPLITERHECLLKHFMHMTNEIYPLTVSIDAPVDGPQLLMDSVSVFLNETLYAYFDNGEDCRIPYESVFTGDVKQLVEHYQKAYASFFQVDTTEIHEFETDCLEVNLIAQTDNYVTYEVNHIFYGEGIETTTEWSTFVKSDGHRLTEVISEYEMLRFYHEHPELRNDDVWENILYHIHHGDSLYGVVCSVGLLDDIVAHQYVYAAGIYEDVKYPTQAIAPYLSKEVQKLIKRKNHSSK